MKNMHLFASTLLLTSAACATNSLPDRDLGDTTASLSAAAGDAVIGRAPIVGPDGKIDSFIAGHWVGRADDPFGDPSASGQPATYVFPSGSADIRLDIDLSHPDATEPGGTIVFGTGIVPAPSADVPYPPGFDYFSAMASDPSSRYMLLPPLEGFSYALRENPSRLSLPGLPREATGVAAGMLALSYQQDAPFAPWCALETPHPRGAGDFDCAGISGGTKNLDGTCTQEGLDGTTEPIDCDLWALCSGKSVCQCNIEGCFAEDELFHDLWLIRDGDDLIGTLSGAVFDFGTPGRFLPIGSIRFQREAP